MKRYKAVLRVDFRRVVTFFVAGSRKLKVLSHKKVRDSRGCEGASVCQWLMAEKVFQLVGFFAGCL